MDRAYLLLRNNQQSGPFTIGELLQQQLLPSDMIWIEGKSTAWTYLSELELIPFIEKAETSSQSPLNARDEIERKAEQLRQRILTTPPKNYFQNHTPEIETYASSYKLDDEIQFIDYRKERRLKKNTAFAELLLTCLVIGLFMVGIYKGKSFLGARHKVENSVATELSSGDQHAARKGQEPALAVAVVDTTKKADSLLALEKAKQKPLKKTVVDSTNTALGQPVNASTISPEKKDESTIQTPPTVSQEVVVKKEDDTPARKETVTSVPETKAVKEPVKEEKKGFLRGLFKKKKDKGE